MGLSLDRIGSVNRKITKAANVNLLSTRQRQDDDKKDDKGTSSALEFCVSREDMSRGNGGYIKEEVLKI